MTVKLNKNTKPSDVAKALKKQGLKKKDHKDGTNFFGSLKRGLDGMDYQKKVRSDWA